MALNTQSVNTTKADEDRTPEYYTAIDAEGKGYLAKRKVEERPKEEGEEDEYPEVKVEEPIKSTKKKGGKK